MWPCATSASATYSSNDFRGISQHPDRLGREFHQPLLIILLPLELGARQLHGNVTGELQANGLRPLRDSQQLDWHAVHTRLPGPVRRLHPKIFGANAQPNAVAQESAGVVWAGQLEIGELE